MTPQDKTRVRQMLIVAAAAAITNNDLIEDLAGTSVADIASQSDDPRHLVELCARWCRRYEDRALAKLMELAEVASCA
jgi:hypothetical protein